MIIRTLPAQPADRVAQLSAQPPRQAHAPEPSPAITPASQRFRRARILFAVLFAATLALSLTACKQDFYKFPEFNFAGRPVPPSMLAQRVMVSVTSNGSNGALIILDGLRDIRNNVENTVQGFAIAGYSGGVPTQIYSFPEETRGYVYSSLTPYALGIINYGTEASTGSVPSLGPSSSIAIAPDFVRILSANEQTGQLIVNDGILGTTYFLNLPGVYRVASNRGDSVSLAMVRNSNSLYRVVKLNQNALAPPGAIDCEPTVLPIYCVLPVPGNFDRPQQVVFAVDGSNAYVLSCGIECGGGTNGGASVSFIPQGPLDVNTVPTSFPYPAVVTNTIPIPGGATAGLDDGINLYVSGQQLQPDGLFAGRLTTLNLTTLVPGAPVSISDGTHTKMLFADDNTLWIGSQFCSTGERAHQATLGATGQAANYNCLTRYDLGAGTASIVPALAPNSYGAQSVPYPNADNNLVYYGSLTGLCWVQTFHKVYTAYGGQVHAFNTVDGSEINNTNITVQGTALDVAYMDALTNSAN